MCSLRIRNVKFLIKSLRRILQTNITANVLSKRSISTTPMVLNKDDEEPEQINPIRRTFRILANDFRFLRKYLPIKNRPAEFILEEVDSNFQTHCDVLIIGNGGVGSSTAYWLKKEAREGLNVVVVDKDTQYRDAASTGLCQHVCLPENIQMARFGADFIRESKAYLGDVNLNFMPSGSLILANEEQAQALTTMARTHSEFGIRNRLFSAEKLTKFFPWLNVDGIALGYHGLERVGWFDDVAFLNALRIKACQHGAHFITADLIKFDFDDMYDTRMEGTSMDQYNALRKVLVRLPNGKIRAINCAICIIAGQDSRRVCQLARIGYGPGLLSVPLPMETRYRYNYVLKHQSTYPPAFSMPLTIDSSGICFKRNTLNGDMICSQAVGGAGKNQAKEYFEKEIQPNLQHRVPAFKNTDVQNIWTDTYEFNSFDGNGIMGGHPYYSNLYIAIGFNEFGLQQVPAIGRAISEVIIHGRYRSIDLTRFGFDRLLVKQPLQEAIGL